MDALVSGQAGVAVFIQGNDASWVSVDAPEQEISCSPHLVPYLLEGASDVTEFKAVSKPVALSHLKLASDFDRALHTTLILLDPLEDRETRIMASECLPDLLTSEGVRTPLENILYSSGMPNVETLGAAISLAPTNNALFSLLQELLQFQDVIRTIRKKWDELPLNLFDSDAAKDAFRVAAVKSGAFRSLAKSSSDPSSMSLAILGCYATLRNLPNYRAVLNAWLTEFRPERIRRAEAAPKEAEDEAAEVPAEKGRYSKRTLSALEAFENVKKQKQAIIPLLRSGDPQKVRRFVDDLVASQLKSGDAKYAAMSLCDLSKRAKDVCNYSLQLEFAKRAVDISPDDGWAYGQLADAYVRLGQFGNAWESFKMAALYGGAAYASTGQARILLAQGHLEEALKAFDQAIKDFPNDAFPWVGRAEVLREMWRYDESLAAYEETILRFPSASVPRCGRAAVLEDLGRLVDALKAYSDAIEIFPDEVVPRDGYADVLTEMGQLQEALDAYDEVITLFPEDGVARCGRARVLGLLGRFEEALRSYTDTLETFPYVSFPYSGRAEVLRQMGNLQDALQAYEDAIARFPSESRAYNGRANILKKLGRLDESLQAYDQTIKNFPYDIIAWSGRADLLKELGNLQGALEAYDVLIKRNPARQSLRFAKAAILAAMRQYSEAESLLPTNMPETHDDWIAYHIRGIILLKRDMLELAIRHLQKGLDLIPFADQRQYFRNALAVATLRQRRYHEATEYLREGKDAMTDLLRMHAFGEMRRLEEASQAYGRLVRTCPHNLVPLRNELGAKYNFFKGHPSRDAVWVFQEECRNVLLEAA